MFESLRRHRKPSVIKAIEADDYHSKDPEFEAAYSRSLEVTMALAGVGLTSTDEHNLTAAQQLADIDIPPDQALQMVIDVSEGRGIQI